MSKFNWNRFYDELEEGDLAKFPFWMFLVNEFVSLVTNIVAGVFVGFAILIVVICSLGIWSKYLESHPDLPIRAFCTSYLD